MPFISKESFWGVLWDQFYRRKMALFALGVVLLLFAMALFAPVLANNEPIMMQWQGNFYFPAIRFYPEFVGTDFVELRDGFTEGEWALFPLVPYSPFDTDLEKQLSPPDSRHWLGTDDVGRDVLARMIHGARVSLSVGFVAVSIYAFIGIVIGSIAGYFGGVVDLIFQRIIEVFMCFPTLILIIAVVAIFPPSIYTVMVAIGLVGWTGVARLVRGEFLKLRSREFVTAAEALGLSTGRIIFRHILPNALAPVFVAVTFGIADAILIESALSFLGFGVPPPTPSWGDTLSQSRKYYDFAWWLTVYPGLAIFITITAYNLVGEGLRESIDARQKL